MGRTVAILAVCALINAVSVITISLAVLRVADRVEALEAR